MSKPEEEGRPKRTVVERVGLVVYINGEPGPMLNMPLFSERYLYERRIAERRR